MKECDIFMQALEIESPEDREAYLKHACMDDPEIRQRVDKLLHSHEAASSLFEHPAFEPAATKLLDLTDASRNSSSGQTESPSEKISLDFLEPSTQINSLGRLGQYEILETIGRGGMGIVLKAYDTKLRRIVAVKVLASELAHNPTARKRFSREAQAAAAVSHDHVVTIHAVEDNDEVTPGKLPYLVMEFIDGQSLQEKIDREGQFELKEILRIGRQIAAGLAAAHQQGLIHRDIKPSNILLQNGIERVQITDFGLSRAAADVDLTRTGEIAGTPQYMSPEQAQGLAVDARSDLFSLGSVMYAMCAGRSPFRADTGYASLKRVCEDEPRPLSEISPETPAWLIAIIAKLLRKNPAERFQSAQEVADLLAQHLAHLQDPQGAAFPATIKPVEKLAPNRQHRWLVPLLLVIGLIGIVGMTEATGLTKFSGSVIRLVTGEGTLVIEVDDPTIEISLDGEELSITGEGLKELKLRPGQYKFQATKDGKPIEQRLVSISRGGREVVSVTQEPPVRSTTAGGQVAFLPDSRRVVFDSQDGTVRLWQLPELARPAAEQRAFALSRQGRRRAQVRHAGRGGGQQQSRRHDRDQGQRPVCDRADQDQSPPRHPGRRWIPAHDPA